MDDSDERRVLKFRRRKDQPPPALEDDALDEAANYIRGVLHQAAEGPTLPDLDEDWEAVDDERLFRKRFALDACRERRKAVVLYFKHEADVTDEEIRVLARSGALQFKGIDEIEIETSRIEQIWGYILCTAISLLMTLGFLAAMQAKSPTWLQMGLVALFEGMLAALVWAVLYQYVRPNQIRRRLLLARERRMQNQSQG